MTTTSREDTTARIVSLIPKGKDNAISRAWLIWALDTSDRQVRKMIAQAREDGYLIINTGKGYYIPDDVADLIRFYRRERKRAISIFVGLKNTRAQLKEMGVEV